MIKSSTAPYAVLLLRVSLGVMFLAHVALKIFVFTVPGFVGYFASLGLPAIVAYGTIALELLGGIALILGIYVSWVALPLATIPEGRAGEQSDPAALEEKPGAVLLWDGGRLDGADSHSAG